MTRQEKLKEIGEMGVEAYTSKFIIPIPHKFYKNSLSIFESLKTIGWKIKNENPKATKAELGVFQIKKYVYENMIPCLDKGTKKDYLTDSNALFLQKILNKRAFLNEFEFQIEHIDLWLFEEHIGFFVFNITIDMDKYSIERITKFHSQFRNFKFLRVEETDQNLQFSQTDVREGEQINIIEYLIKLTKIDGKSFLNIESESLKEIDNKTLLEQHLFTIYNTSANAKLLTAIHTNKNKYSNCDFIEDLQTENVNFLSNNEMSTLCEATYYLAACSSFSPIESWTSNDDYIYQTVNTGGFNIWKYSSGLTIHDSCALLGIQNLGGNVVGNTNGPFYFIYMLNLYINFQIRYIENKLINKDFEATDITYWYKKLQKLQNQFITKDIAIKFQENEFNKSIYSALYIEEMISEVSKNLVETKSITESNIGIYMTLIGFIFVSLLEEPLKNIISEYGIVLAVIGLPTAYFIYKYRNKIRKLLKL